MLASEVIDAPMVRFVSFDVACFPFMPSPMLLRLLLAEFNDVGILLRVTHKPDASGYSAEFL